MTHQEEIERVVEEYHNLKKPDYEMFSDELNATLEKENDEWLRTTLHTHTLRILERVEKKAQEMKLVDPSPEGEYSVPIYSHNEAVKELLTHIQSMKNEVMNKPQ